VTTKCVLDEVSGECGVAIISRGAYQVHPLPSPLLSAALAGLRLRCLHDPFSPRNPLISLTTINTSITIARGASQPPGKRLEEGERRLYLLIEGA
jgi:hypothetical protein